MGYLTDGGYSQKYFFGEQSEIRKQKNTTSTPPPHHPPDKKTNQKKWNHGITVYSAHPTRQERAQRQTRRRREHGLQTVIQAHPTVDCASDGSCNCQLTGLSAWIGMATLPMFSDHCGRLESNRLTFVAQDTGWRERRGN